MRKLLLATVLAVGASSASATVIDFEGLTAGDNAGTIGNATFSGPSGAIIWDFGGSFAQSGVNTLGGAGGNFNADILVTFTDAVSDLSFWSGGDDAFGLQALIDIFVGGIFFTTVDLTGDGNSSTTDFQDLTSFSNVTSIFIRDVTDPAGLVYDDFSFQSQVAAVPVPAAGFLLFGALGGLSLLRRRKTA